jgi:hypothetical protein
MIPKLISPHRTVPCSITTRWGPAQPRREQINMSCKERSSMPIEEIAKGSMGGEWIRRACSARSEKRIVGFSAETQKKSKSKEYWRRESTKEGGISENQQASLVK